MESIRPNIEELKQCMEDCQCIRNVCILAHVDHGKTTLADLLLATNRLVSKKMAGLLRYLDNRADEQLRGITMKSSAVSLLNNIYDNEIGAQRKILLNLIDTPGHIDFSSEVGAAIRVCDGAIILVDIVEGVCAQTTESIRIAFEEHAKMILIINKLDRLILELDQNIESMFQSINKVIEDCNVVIADLFKHEFINDDIDIEDTDLLFNPDSGNVIFASAIDGWGFTTKQIAEMFINVVKNETVDSLNKKLWNFDCWMDSKCEIKTGALEKQKPNLFIQLCLKTIVHVYDTIVVRMGKDKIPGILKKLNINNPSRDMMTCTDSRSQIKAILSAWKPLSSIVLLQSLKIIPSPLNMSRKKIDYLLNANTYIEDPYLYKCVLQLVPHFTKKSKNSNNDDSPVFAYISKMFCVDSKCLSQNAPKPFTPRAKLINGDVIVTKRQENLLIEEDKEQSVDDQIQEISEKVAVIALTRVFSGSLKIGQELYTLDSDYLPKENVNDVEEFISSNKHIHKIKIKELYMLFGKELVLVDSVPAGNFCGIGGVEDKVIRTATLTSTIDAVPVVEHFIPVPVVKYAIEPSNPKELPLLLHGLKLLLQSDSCVQVKMQESGEIIILTAGDVHLEKCNEDLKNKFAKVDFQVSSAMVAVRETVVQSEEPEVIDIETGIFQISMAIVAIPAEIIEIIQKNQGLLKSIEDNYDRSLIDLILLYKKNVNNQNCTLNQKKFKSDFTNRGLIRIKQQLSDAFASSGSLWKNMENKIWSIGKLNECVNLLINDTDDYVQNIFLETNIYDKRTLLAQCILNPFHNFCKSGPICEEPLANCAFLIKRFRLINDDIGIDEITPSLLSSEEIAVRNIMKTCFIKQGPRLMEPMYTTSIVVNTSVLGKVYTVINKRHGKVLEAVGMDEKEKLFMVQAQISVLHSEGFANEIRKTTSGQANPSLKFSHYEVIDGDPFIEPVEDEDNSDEEETNIESALRANKLRREIRRRKGLHIDDEVVIHAEKQRTLKK